MGTIAELLGIDLSGEEPSEPAGASGDEDGAASGEGEAPEAAAAAASSDPVGEAVMAAVLAEAALDPADARADLALDGPELDLDRLGRYSVVTAIEHGLGVRVPDVDVEAMGTLGDLLETARALAGHSDGRRGRAQR
jgi:acyl carrier protein